MLDASVVIEILLMTPDGTRLADRLLGGPDTLHAPHLLDIEVVHVLRRYERAGYLSAERGAEALADLAGFPLERYSHEPLLPRIWSLRGALTGYDAAYVALAQGLQAKLLTRDRRLARGVGPGVRVELT